MLSSVYTNISNAKRELDAVKTSEQIDSERSSAPVPVSSEPEPVSSEPVSSEPESSVPEESDIEESSQEEPEVP